MKGYRKYFSKKILWFVITFIVALLLNFLLPRLMPGDPVAAMTAKQAQGISEASAVKAIYDNYAKEFGTNKPITEQFVIYIGNLLHGDMGTSFSQYPRKITDIIGSAIVWTLCLQFPAIIVGWLLGNILGALAAYIRKGFDKVLMPLMLFFSSVPAFGMAVVLLVVFAINLKIAPISGGYGFDMIPNLSWNFVRSVIEHYQLPFLSIVLIAIGGQAIGMRSMSIYELNADYVKYARYLGIRDRKVVGYVFRNAMLPQVTGLALSIGTMVSGALVAEIIFSYPGLGTTIYQGITMADYPLISGTTLIITVMVLIATFVLDIIYGFIDPRVRAAQFDQGGERMKNMIRQVFHSPKFVIGFSMIAAILLTMLIYPLVNPGDPLEMIGLGTFAKPGTYLSLYDSVGADSRVFKLPDAEEKRIAQLLSGEDRVNMLNWFTAVGAEIADLDMQDTDALLAMWKATYDPTVRPSGMTKAMRNYYIRLNDTITSAATADALTVSQPDADTGGMAEVSTITKNDYVNVGDVANVKTLPLGTDNFGRDTFKELVAACGTSIKIGLIAGAVATLIGLLLGLLAGYLGGVTDDIVMFFTNIFTVIPSFVLLILINYSINQDQRGAETVALVIGLTSWVWTTRSVRSQVTSLRNRDHVNLSRLSGHSVARIIITDILPYIASYVVMAFILQVSSGILAEAQLSLLGLGPKTTEVPTLGLMMNWAMLYSAHLNGSWWAYFPVILLIALISFSLNLMNTGLDQVFNPTLRDQGDDHEQNHIGSPRPDHQVHYAVPRKRIRRGSGVAEN